MQVFLLKGHMRLDQEMHTFLVPLGDLVLKKDLKNGCNWNKSKITGKNTIKTVKIKLFY